MSEPSTLTAPDAAPDTSVAPTKVETPIPTGTWRDTLPDDLKTEKAFETISDVPTLARSFLHFRKVSSAEKLPVPNQHFTEDDWKGVFHKLGLPEKLEEYKLETKGLDGLSDTAVGEFKQLAHKAGILPKQAQALLAWEAQRIKVATEQATQAKEHTLKEGVEVLKKEWGQAYDQQVGLAKRALKETAQEGFLGLLDKEVDGIPLGSHPEMIRYMAKQGQQYKEGDIPGNGTGRMMKTPDEAQREIQEIFAAGPTHPYRDKKNPLHARAVADMAALTQMANPR